MKGRKSWRLRRPVGGRHDDETAGKQLLEQPAQDHRIGDVGDVEFVETEQPGLCGDAVGDHADGVVGLVAVLAFLVDAPMDVAHEGVEVDAALARDRRAFEEEVHQQRLAAADPAPQIDAARHRIAATPAEQGAQQAMGRPPLLAQFPGQGLQAPGSGFLGGIAAQRAGRAQGEIAVEGAVGHGARRTLGRSVGLARRRAMGNARA